MPDDLLQKMHKHYAVHIFRYSNDQDETCCLFHQSAVVILLKHPEDLGTACRKTSELLEQIFFIIINFIYCCYLQRETYKTLYLYLDF